MKKIIAVISSILLIFSTCLSASAQSLLISSVTKEGGNWVVKGTWPGKEPLTIEVLKETIDDNGTQRKPTWEDLSSVESADILNYLAYFNQTDASNNNNEFKFAVSGFSAEPEIRVFTDGEFFYHSRETLDKINNATDVNEEFPEEEFDDLIMGYPFLNQAVTKIIDPLSEDEKEEFWNKLYIYKESKESGFVNFGELVTSASEIAVLSKVALSQTKEDLAANLELMEAFGIKDSNSFDIYMNINEFKNEDYLTQAHRDYLFGDLKNNAHEINTADGFIEYFSSKVVLVACFENVSDYVIKNIIEKSDILEEEGIGKFSKLKSSQKLEIANAINDSQAQFPNLLALAEFISDMSAKYSNKESSSGGGGGGGGGGGFSAPDIVYDVTTNPSGIISDTSDVEKFADITSYEWAQEAIYALREKGIVSGTSDKTFEPERSVTREEFVKMIVLALGVLDENAVSPFEDSPADAWYTPYVASAYKANLVAGITENAFGVGEYITREQLAVMIYRAMSSSEKFIQVTPLELFTDFDAVSSYAKEAVKYVSGAGIMNGMGDGSFAPLDKVTRAQAAKVIYELI